MKKKIVRKGKAFLFLFIVALRIAVSCNNAPGTALTPIDSTTNHQINSDKIITDTAVSYTHFNKYLPLAIKGFKTEGYPDTLDRFTGAPTGETGSLFTSGGKLSFIKHLYKNGESEVALEIIDYKLAPDAYKGLLRMYDIDHVEDNDLRETELIESDFPGVQAKQVYDKEDKNITIHAFVCNRFIINVQVVKAKATDQAKDVLALIKLEELIKDYCSE